MVVDMMGAREYGVLKSVMSLGMPWELGFVYAGEKWGSGGTPKRLFVTKLADCMRSGVLQRLRNSLFNSGEVRNIASRLVLLQPVTICRSIRQCAVRGCGWYLYTFSAKYDNGCCVYPADTPNPEERYAVFTLLLLSTRQGSAKNKTPMNILFALYVLPYAPSSEKLLRDEIYACSMAIPPH